MTHPKLLVLGGGDGWHADQLRQAASRQECELSVASYETLCSQISDGGKCEHQCDAGPIEQFDAILTRTMPAGSLERITYRLAVLHCLAANLPIINRPRGLEIAIDKFATLAHVASIGYRVPETVVAQSRRDAMAAFDQLGGDCIVKPIFGGEGRGVSRIRDPELAWYAFATLDQLDAALYVQRFVPPGGIDTRLFVIGDEVIGLRRESFVDFRTNVRGGSRCWRIDPSPQYSDMARRIATSMDLDLAAVDVIEDPNGNSLVLEVNAIPGWRAAQRVVEFCIADKIIQLLIDRCERQRSDAEQPK